MNTDYSNDQYKGYFQNDVSPAFWIEFSEPIPINLEIEDQIKLIYDRGIVKDAGGIALNIQGAKVRDEVIGKPIIDLTLPTGTYKELPTYNNYIQLIQNGYQSTGTIYTKINLEGDPVWIFVQSSGIIRDGLLEGILGTMIDITEMKNKEELLKTNLQLSEMSISSTIDDVLQTFLNKAEELTGSSIGFFHFLEDDQIHLKLQMWSTNTLQTMCTAQNKGDHYPISEAGVWVDCVRAKEPVIHNDYQALEHKKGLPDGHAPIVRELVVPVIRGGKVKVILGVGNKLTFYNEADVEIVSSLANLAWDIVERKRTEGELSVSEEFTENLIDTANAMIVGLDNDGNVTIFNRSAEKITGYSKQDFIGQNWFEIVTPRNKYPEVWEEFDRITKGGIPRNFENPILTKSGEEKYIVWQNNEIVADGEITGLISFGIDITGRKKAEEELEQHRDHLEALVHERTVELERLAITDELTGIANRRHGIELIEKVLLDSDRYGDSVSFYLFDIDHFKQVNDNFGHLCGDDALVAVTDATARVLRKNDIVCRYGGEEFLVCLPRTALKGAVLVADRIKEEINTTLIDCIGKALTVSGGVIERKPKESLKEIIRRTDELMYKAKNSGRDQNVY